MIIKHEEYDILVRASSGNFKECTYLPNGECKNITEFDLHFSDDRQIITKQFLDICSKHLLVCIIEGISR